tara:strand:+ start:1670 stop:2008 length:339 start_codon:yes stop_codon:yes gene_type:complete
MSEQNDIEKEESCCGAECCEEGCVCKAECCKGGCACCKRDSQGDVKYENKLGWVDKFMGKFVSRKLLVFSTATALLAMSELDTETWGLIAIIYVGGQSVIDAVKTYKHGGSV